MGVDNVSCVTKKTAYLKINRMTDFFSEYARIRAKIKGKLSPYEYWQRNKEKIIASHMNLADQREAIYQATPEATLFKISTTYRLLTYFKSKKVLDPSAGWGDRVLGAAYAGVDVYHGVDPNKDLRQAYDNILEYINMPNFSILTEDFLQTTLNGEYDTVFTSPPFFDFEIYSTDNTQSIAGRSTIQDWQEKFYRPYLTKAWNALAKGGKMCIYVSDNKKITGLVSGTFEVMESLGGQYAGAIAIVNDELTRPFPLWVWYK